LGRPTRSIGGWLVSKLFKTRNQVLEESAVQLCRIQPGDTVLELGHGPGLGLESAAKLLTGPAGHMIGLDYSEYMHQLYFPPPRMQRASRLKRELQMLTTEPPPGITCWHTEERIDDLRARRICHDALKLPPKVVKMINYRCLEAVSKYLHGPHLNTAAHV
ncbi:hypothetical protein GOODEAATRI_020058, partial [Goodea atripinnis]